VSTVDCPACAAHLAEDQQPIMAMAAQEALIINPFWHGVVYQTPGQPLAVYLDGYHRAGHELARMGWRGDGGIDVAGEQLALDDGLPPCPDHPDGECEGSCAVWDDDRVPVQTIDVRGDLL
jgi:hypothetical protein